jgi:hypothetical protein
MYRVTEQRIESLEVIDMNLYRITYTTKHGKAKSENIESDYYKWTSSFYRAKKTLVNYKKAEIFRYRALIKISREELKEAIHLKRFD